MGKLAKRVNCQTMKNETGQLCHCCGKMDRHGQLSTIKDERGQVIVVGKWTDSQLSAIMGERHAKWAEKVSCLP